MGTELQDSTIEGDALKTPSSLRVLIFGADSYVSMSLPSSGSVSIGRAKEADVRTDDGSISRLHARLFISPAPTGVRLQIEDLESANGTTVRGKRLAAGERADIAPGEMIDLGKATMLVQAPPRVGASTAVERAAEDHEPAPPRTIVTSSAEPMRSLFELIDRVARAEMNVLVAGETGAGKDVVAERIHASSNRARKKLVRIACDALSEVMVERELFGVESGAGAKPGLFEEASGGTILLDGVTDLPLALQAKLLRVIEEKRVIRVGSLKPRDVDVRFISTTNRDLSQAIDAGEFRSDLFFRLNAVSIVVPPLRDRRSEIAPLARAFAAQGVKKIDDAALAALEAHRWPGNVRELKNAIARAAVIAPYETIGVEHLPPFGDAAPPAVPKPAQQGKPSSIDIQTILDALDRCGGNQTRAAAMLGIARGTLISRLEQHGVPRPKKGR